MHKVTVRFQPDPPLELDPQTLALLFWALAALLTLLVAADMVAELLRRRK